MIIVIKDGYRLQMAGHAGYAAAGEDIVCAAISALFCTLAGGLSAHEELFDSSPSVLMRPGDAIVECIPKDGCRDKVDLIYDIFMSGIYSVAMEHPKYVKVIIK